MERRATALTVGAKGRWRIDIEGFPEIDVTYDFPIILQSVVTGPDHLVADAYFLLEVKIVHDPSCPL